MAAAASVMSVNAEVKERVSRSVVFGEESLKTGLDREGVLAVHTGGNRTEPAFLSPLGTTLYVGPMRVLEENNSERRIRCQKDL